ncbi:YicC family protein [Paenibacillus athensensis]|uniref:YicC family protein n=1 Tax=Paenibacillus athensensis TaxID=1967502 RepID=A0A4Y8PZA5_9BACL|nr:YicC/YloC family endoribonuclease [Paenibacillus athensensis]MCD1257909.1 YicC family protein [Paenibacillus athensensis]
MLCSMTGFGQASRSFAGYKVFIDIKSVNHRYSEVSFRMPREWAGLEDGLRKAVLKTVKRGRVDVFVTVERDILSSKSVSVDWALAEGYMQAAGQLRERYGFGQTPSLQDLLALPNLIVQSEERTDADEEMLAQELGSCLAGALDGLSAMRRREGEYLAGDLRQRLAALERLHGELAELAPQVVTELAARLEARVQSLLREPGALDPQRLAAEVALLADRSNVDEELTRLSSHFAQLAGLLADEEPVGRKLDFLIQEMNREANTIGSKSNHAELTARVIELKAELEKMREQIQNIE